MLTFKPLDKEPSDYSKYNMQLRVDDYIQNSKFVFICQETELTLREFNNLIHSISEYNAPNKYVEVFDSETNLLIIAVFKRV